MIETLLAPFSFPFMQQAMIIAVLVAIPMGLLSPFLVLKGWSLMGDAISHAVLPGIVLAYIIGIPLVIGAFAAGLFCAVSTGFIKQNSRIKEDTVMGIVFSGMFGLGLVLYTSLETELHLDHILFGDMLGVGWADIAEAATIAAIVGALKAVGIILDIAMLIAPGAIAFLLVNRFGAMLALSFAIAVTASFLGVYLSFFLDSAPAPTIVLLMSIGFVAAFIRTRIEAARASRTV